jgi:nucleoside-diphosphate-sugar epimerase
MTTPQGLVPGATGFLGRHLLRSLSAAQLPAAVLVRARDAWGAEPWHAEVGPVSVIAGQALSSEGWRADTRLAQVRAVFHAAGMVRHTRSAPEEMIDFNVRGTLEMVHVAARLGARLVFVSSSGTVGCFRSGDIHAEEDAPYAEALAGRWPYYASKIRAEREARALAQKLGVELTIVRPPVLLGPEDHRRRSTGYVQKVLDGKVPVVPPGGMHFTDVRDVASALTRLAQLPTARDIYHLPGTATTLREFFGMVTEVSGAPAVERPLPRWAALGLARFSQLGGRIHPSLPDPVVLEMATCFWGLASLFAHELGYAPRPGRQTLCDTVSWLRANPAPHGAHAHAASKRRPPRAPRQRQLDRAQWEGTRTPGA